MIWPFRSSRATYIYMRRDGPKASWWTARVRYDPWGQPYAYDDDWLIALPYNIFRGGSTSHHATEWKHKSGPPVDFTGKHSKSPPI